MDGCYCVMLVVRESRRWDPGHASCSTKVPCGTLQACSRL